METLASHEAPASAPHPVANRSWRLALTRLFLPSLSDCLFLAIFVWVFAAGSGWSVLLADGDTGWHIRTGEFILDTHSVPRHDLFSFSKAGAPWFAWEWLADVVFACLHRTWGLKGVVVFSAIVLSLSATLLFRHMLWRGSNVLVALIVTLLASGASTIHYLARPHIFTLLGLTLSMWVLDRDLRKASPAVWWLVPLTALWTNLHGGFLAWIACLALALAGSAWRACFMPAGDKRPRSVLRRYGLLAALCIAATLLNPYGYGLHRHMAGYVSSSWIRHVVDEFQSPRFRSESMLQFEILLFAGIGLLPILWRGHRFGELLTIVFWAHAALQSARHVPIYAIVAAPVCAVEASLAWSLWSHAFAKDTALGALRDCLNDFSLLRRRTSLSAVILLGALLSLRWEWPRDFPANKFPSAAIHATRHLIAPAGRPAPRLLTSDQWGDYLIYCLYPDVKVFVDGRSDFYGPSVGREYLDLLNAAPNWERIMDRYRFEVALLPAEWPLGQMLLRDDHWRVRFMDQQAILLQRRSTPH